MKKLLIVILLFGSWSILHAQENYLKAVAHIAQGKYIVADSILSDLIEQDNNWKYFYYRGISRYNLNQTSEAHSDFNFVHSDNTPNVYLWRARLYAKNFEAQLAINNLNTYIGAKGTNYFDSVLNDKSFKTLSYSPQWKEFESSDMLTDIDYKTADILFYLKKGYYDDALNIIEQLDENNEHTSYLKALHQVKTNNPNGRIALKELHQQNPENKKYTFAFIDALSTKNPAESALVLNNYLKSNPEDFKQYLKLCELYIRANQHNQANNVISTYLIHFENDITALKTATNLSLKLNKKNEALKRVNHLFKLTVSDAELFKLRGMVYAKLNKHLLASKDLSMSLDLNPKDPETNLQMGLSEIEMGNTKLGEYYIEKANHYKSLNARVVQP